MTATLTRTTTKKKPVLHIEALAQDLADARAQRRLWETKEAALAEKLVAAHQAGVAPTKFTVPGWSFALQEGRKTIVYPLAVQAEIKFVQEAAVASGVTETKVGNQFWRITAQKEADS